jgi:protein SCO1
MKKNSMIMMVIAIILIVSGCATGDSALPVDARKVETFTFINQEGNQMGLEDLKGKVWIANFIFTNCETVCPPMTANMSKIQELATAENIDMQIVSFSVDPELDTPDTLKKYGEKFQVDYSNWNFLTGYTQKEIESFAAKSFGAIVQKPKSTDQVIHGTSFYLVNKDGYVVTSYSGLENTPYEEIINDIKVYQ